LDLLCYVSWINLFYRWKLVLMEDPKREVLDGITTVTLVSRAKYNYIYTTQIVLQKITWHKNVV
jgi:hypothetical protein